MKYYVVTIQYNKEKKAENREAPKMFLTLEAAEQKFYEQVGKDMANATLGGSLNILMNSDGGIYETKKWGIMEEPEPTPEEVTE